MWIKYRYIFGINIGSWQWRELGEEPTEAEIARAKRTIANKICSDYCKCEFELAQYPSQDFIERSIVYNKDCIVKAKTRIKNIKKYAAKLQNQIEHYENLIEKQKAEKQDGG